MLSNGDMTLDRIIFDHVSSFPFVVTVGCVREKASVSPCIPYSLVMHVVTKGDVFDFIGHGRTKKRIVLCDLRQEWFDFVAM